ncbi:MAG: ester cyclase [Anaerolineae bacterium]|nr:ester cyclase [Anaerolineae bacterium]
MTIEDNKRLVRRYFEDAPFNPAACDEILAPRFQFHTIMHASVTPQVVESGPDSEKAAYERYKATFGEWHFKIEEMIAEDDRVMVR